MLYTDTLIPLLENGIWNKVGVSWRKQKKPTTRWVFIYTAVSQDIHILWTTSQWRLSGSQITSLCNLKLCSGDLLHSNIDSAQLARQGTPPARTGASRRRHRFHPAALRTAISDHMKQPMISMARQLSFILPVITSVGNYYRHSRIKVR